MKGRAVDCQAISYLGFRPQNGNHILILFGIIPAFKMDAKSKLELPIRESREVEDIQETVQWNFLGIEKWDVQ